MIYGTKLSRTTASPTRRLRASAGQAALLALLGAVALPGPGGPAAAQSPSTSAEAPARSEEPAAAPVADAAPAIPARVAAGEVPAVAPGEREGEPLDPLTPPKVELPPAAAPPPVTAKPTEATPAPTAPAAAASGTAASPSSPLAAEVVAEIRRILAEPQPTVRGGPAAEDRAALGAFYADRAEPVWTGREGLTPRATAALAELGRAADWGLDAAAFDVGVAPAAGASPAELAAAEVRVGLAVLKYARHARGGRIADPQAISKMIDMKPRLYEPRSIIDAVAVTDDAAAYLTGLHPRHAGFRRLQTALVELRQSREPAPAAVEEAPAQEAEARKGKGRGAKQKSDRPAKQHSRSDRESRIVVNMERWRWMPDDLGALHVLNNVPEQMTRVYKDGTAVFAERIVVGKPQTPTPLFSADMRFVIFHPTWGVPDGIKTNELGPLLRRASGGGGWFFGGGGDGAARVLERHNLRVYAGGREINPNSVDWNSVDPRRFSFVQPPGGKNVLGVVKFRFPNRHDVYMHDTQDKQLFAHPVRAYSHGCMRVQNPLRFAEVLLAQDKGWTSDRVQSHLGRSGPIDITLDRPIPVHNVYFTASADDAGEVKLHGDLYGMDGRVASALAGRPVQLAAAEVRAPEAGVPRRERPQGAPASGPARPASFNPFSGLGGN